MPVIQFFEDAAGGYPCLSSDLLSVMVFPDDPEQREAARVTGMLDNVTRGRNPNEPITLPIGHLRSVLAGGGLRGREEDQMSAAIGGSAVGDLVLMMLEGARSGATPSVNSSVTLLAEAMSSFRTERDTKRDPDGEKIKKRSYGDRSIRTAWSQYRSVAHFWAAVRQIMAQEQNPKAGQFVLEHQPRLLIQMAMRILDEAAGISLGNSSGPEPMLDKAKAWVPPEGLLASGPIH